MSLLYSRCYTWVLSWLQLLPPTNHAIQAATVLYQVIAEHLETFLASLDDDPDAKGLPVYVQREFYDYLRCGILAHGFLRLGCDSCRKEILLPFSCKRCSFCPSCSGRRIAQTAAHLVECVMPWVAMRQWVISVPIPLRYWMATSRDLTTQVHRTVRNTIAQYYVNQAVCGGAERRKVQPGSVTFLQRFGSSINLNLHFHVIFLEGVYLDRTGAGLTPRFIKAEPPGNADISTVLQKISHRVIRKLRRLGYLEAGIDVPVATGCAPLLDNEPELARSMAASVRQRIAFGQRAGEKVRRIGHGFGYEGERPELKGVRCVTMNGFSLHANTDVAAHRRDQLERLLRYTTRGAVSLERLTQDDVGDVRYRFTRAWSDGTMGIKLSPLELIEKLAALVPPPHAHLLHYSGCLAPNSKLRAQVIPTSRQQGAGSEEAKPQAPYWSWVRLLGRVFALDMSRCPFCQRGALHIIAAITQEEVTTRILRHLKLASVPPPIAPSRRRQAIFAFDEGPVSAGA